MPEAMRQYVEDQVGGGGYGNVSEYFRSLVRDDQRKVERARLEAMLFEGLTAEEADGASDAQLRDLRAEALRIVRSRRTG